MLVLTPAYIWFWLLETAYGGTRNSVTVLVKFWCGASKGSRKAADEGQRREVQPPRGSAPAGERCRLRSPSAGFTNVRPSHSFACTATPTTSQRPPYDRWHRPRATQLLLACTHRQFTSSADACQCPRLPLSIHGFPRAASELS